MWLTIQASAVLSLIAFLAVGSAASSPVGVAKARGNFRVDDATVYHNSTVFDGSTVETEMVPIELNLIGGTRLLLAPSSRSKVYRNRAVLEKGAARLEGGDHYPIEARTLRIVRNGSNSTAQVTLGKADEVQVLALGGPVQVTNAQGVVVANLMPVGGLALNPQEDVSFTKVTGRVEQKDGHFILTDETTNVTVELQGPGIEAHVGNVVEVTGNVIANQEPVAGAIQVLQVSSINAVAPTVAAASSVAAGLTVATKVAIVGGVAAAATVTGMAVGGVFEEEKLPVSP